MLVVNECKVEFVNSMGSDMDVCDAARVSFDKKSDVYTKESNEKLIRFLAEYNHWSPFSHVFMSIRVGAPIFVARQLAKHQVGLSWNEVSRRYVASEPTMFLPKEWRMKSVHAKQGSLDFKPAWATDDNISHLETLLDNALIQYTLMLEGGVCPEQARMVLPQNMMTEWVWSGSVYAFARVCNLRLDAHTQRETQDVTKKIYSIMQEHFPICTKELVHGQT